MAADHKSKKAKKEKKKERNMVIDFFAGGVSGTVSKTLTAPIEYHKLLDQLQPTAELLELPVDHSRASFLDMWAGNTVNIMRYFPTQSFNLLFKKRIEALFPKYNYKTHFWKSFFTNLTSGVVTAALSLVFVYPLDTARTRQAFGVVCPAVAKSVYTSYLPSGRQVGLWEWNVAALFNDLDVSGIWTTVSGILAYRTAQFGLGNTIMTFLGPEKGVFGAAATLQKFFAAQIAVSCAGLIAYPFDTIRRALQIQACLPPSEWKFTGMLSCARYIVDTTGVKGLWAGATNNILRGVAASVVLVLYGELALALEARATKEEAKEEEEEEEEEKEEET